MTSTAELVVRLARDRGLLTAAQLEETAAKLAASDSPAPREPPGSRGASFPAERLVAALVDDGRLDEDAVVALLAAEFSLPTVRAGELAPTPAALAAVPRELAERLGVLPLDRRGATLRVAIADPLATDALDAVAHGLGLALDPVLAPAAALRRAIARSYGAAPADERAVPAPAAASLPETAADDSAVIHLAARLLATAVERRASDLHVEPRAARVVVRHRIDGVLHDAEFLPKELQLPLVSRLKLQAGLSLAEKRLPQDGRCAVAVGARAVDVRVSCLPTVHGESLVLRVLDGAAVRPRLEELGLAPDHLAQFERWLRRPDGLVLVCGPTGSGKTTTLYSCLQRLNDPGRKLVTVEDPVEYRLPGVNQVSVREETGLTFATALRAILRQSPNVVMVGEIRDRATAESAVQAALTGHLVLSTLHTNDAAGAAVRLLDLGVPAFLVAAALRGVAAQRLVRRVCPECVGTGSGAVPACPACGGTGFRGRAGLFELLELGPALAALVQAGAGVGELRAAARRRGARSLRADGWAKVAAGVTTRAEVAAAAAEEAD